MDYSPITNSAFSLRMRYGYTILPLPHKGHSDMAAKELFISYGREAAVSQFVEKLKTDVEAVGFSVWLDTHDIPSGSDWHGAIGAGLSHCKAILPVITQKYLGSRYCVNEVSPSCIP